MSLRKEKAQSITCTQPITAQASVSKHLSFGLFLREGRGGNEDSRSLTCEQLDTDDGVGDDHDEHGQEVHHDALHRVVGHLLVSQTRASP